MTDQRAPRTPLLEHNLAHIAAAEDRTNTVEALEHLAALRRDLVIIDITLRRAIARAIPRARTSNESLTLADVGHIFGVTHQRAGKLATPPKGTP